MRSVRAFSFGSFALACERKLKHMHKWIVIGPLLLGTLVATVSLGWSQYVAAREKIATRFGGNAPETLPATEDHPYLRFMRPLILYDPAPAIRQLKLPLLALFGELDNNILAEKNRAAWEQALKAGGNADYTLQIVPKANHALLEASLGNNSEMRSLQRFVPSYSEIVLAWLSKHGFVAAPPQ